MGGSNNGLETITPLGVLKEIYNSASRNPSLVTFLHLSFSELWHNTQLWASLNSSNIYMVKPRSDGLSLEITSSYFRMCECKTYQWVIMLLVLTVFGIICFIHDSDNDDSEDFNDIIILLDIEINNTILVT